MTTETLITKKITYTFQELADLVAKTNGIVYTGEPHVVFRDDDTCVFEFRKEQDAPVADKDGWIEWEATQYNIRPKGIDADTLVDYMLVDGFTATKAARNVFWEKLNGGTVIKYRIHKD
jgi:hypothetical protein